MARSTSCRLRGWCRGGAAVVDRRAAQLHTHPHPTPHTCTQTHTHTHRITTRLPVAVRAHRPPAVEVPLPRAEASARCHLPAVGERQPLEQAVAPHLAGGLAPRRHEVVAAPRPQVAVQVRPAAEAQAWPYLRQHRRRHQHRHRHCRLRFSPRPPWLLAPPAALQRCLGPQPEPPRRPRPWCWQ